MYFNRLVKARQLNGCAGTSRHTRRATAAAKWLEGGDDAAFTLSRRQLNVNLARPPVRSPSRLSSRCVRFKAEFSIYESTRRQFRRQGRSPLAISRADSPRNRILRPDCSLAALRYGSGGGNA